MRKNNSMIRKGLTLGLALVMTISIGMTGITADAEGNVENVEKKKIDVQNVSVKIKDEEHVEIKLNDSKEKEIQVPLGSKIKVDVTAEEGYQIDAVYAEKDVSTEAPLGEESVDQQTETIENAGNNSDEMQESNKIYLTKKNESYYVTADTSLLIGATISNLQVAKPGSGTGPSGDGSEWNMPDEGEESEEGQGENEKGRKPLYDADALSKLLTDICDFGNVSDIMPMANSGDSITTAPSIGTTDIQVVTYHADGTYTLNKEWGEGRFTTTDGEEVFCCHPESGLYHVGEYYGSDATKYFSNEAIKTIGMMLYYFDNYVDCGSLTTFDKYAIKQCVIWSVVKEAWGVYPGATIEYGNGLYDSAGHSIAGHTYTALMDAATWAADVSNRAEFTCWGVVFEDENTLSAGNGTTQPISQFFYIRNEKGDFELQKSGSEKSVTEGNPCYSLQGAEYTLYDSKGTAATKVTTDENGYAKSDKIQKGSYTLKETKAPKGYALDKTVYNVEIPSGETVKIHVKDCPLSNILDLKLIKTDQDSKGAANVKSLAGAQLEVNYYAVDYNNYHSANELESVNPTRSWIIETKAEKNSDGRIEYRACLNKNYIVSESASDSISKASSEIYHDSSGNAILPLGVLTIKEIKAPEGYKLEGAIFKAEKSSDEMEGIYFAKITGEGSSASAVGGNVCTISDKSIRGGIKIGKWDSELNAQSPQGNATLKNTTVEIINRNDYEVVVAGKTYRKGQTVMSLATDSDGNAQTASDALPYGTYEVKETKAPLGYLKTGKSISQNVSITEDGVIVDLNNDSTAIRDNVIRGGIQLGKWDNESNSQKAQGSATLKGAKFKITNESSHDVIVNGKTYKKGEVVVTLTTNEKGIAKSDADFLPYGKYSYEEIKSPTGYLATGSGLSGTFEIKEKGVIVNLNKKDAAVKNNVIRGDITFTKSDAETSERMANIPFKITSNTTGESHIVYTDENGYYSSESKYVKHSDNTNAEISKCGTWFGLDADGKQVDIKDSVGAFPYDTYTIEELSCNANEGKALFKGTFAISMNAFTIDYGTITNSDLALSTIAKVADTNTHKAFADKEVVVVDNVFYTGLRKGKTYTVKGIIMDKETNEPLLDEEGNQITAETTFKAVTKNGLVDVTFTFDGTKLDGKNIVVFEECYDEDGELVVEHKDIEDEGQTIRFESNPEIKTTATDKKDGDHKVSCGKVTIVDTVKYENLVPGQEYKISGVLMDKSTGEKVLVDKKEITAETAFIAEKINGSVEVIFTFDASSLEKKTLVVFEKLYTVDGKEIANHEDLNDEGQTVTVEEKEKVIAKTSDPTKEEKVVAETPNPTKEEKVATSTPSEIKAESSAVKTGDGENAAIYIALMGLAFVVTLVIAKKSIKS